MPDGRYYEGDLQIDKGEPDLRHLQVMAVAASFPT